MKTRDLILFVLTAAALLAMIADKLLARPEPAPVTLSCPRGAALYSYTSTWGPTLTCRPPHFAPAGAVEAEPVQR